MPGSERRYDLMRKRIGVFARALRGVEAGDVRALHRARVASRRLRELVPVLQLDERTAAKLTKRLRKATSRLGRVRELDVLLQVAGELDAAHPSRVVDVLRSSIEHDRREQRDKLVSNKTVAGLRRLARRLRDIVARHAEDSLAAGAGTPARGWTWAIDARVARRASRVRAAIDAAGTVYVPERLHQVRIALKKFRYGLELAAESRGLKTTPELTALRRGQDLLGRLHDLQMLIARARHARETMTGDRALARDLDRVIDALEIDCRHLHAQYLGERATLVDIAVRATSSRHGQPRPARIRRSA